MEAVETGDLTHRIERLVESLDGIRRCRAAAKGGEIESVVVAAEPDRIPERLVREIRGALLAYLGRSLSPDRIRIEIPDDGGKSEPAHLRGPEELPLPGRAFRSGEDGFWGGRRNGEEGERRPESHGDRPSPARGSEMIELSEYRIVGGRGPGVEVQVSLTDRTGRSYEGSVSAENLATVQSESFVHATVRAASRLLQDHDRGAGAGPVLDVVGLEDGVGVGDDRFFAVTLEARDGTGRVRTTGFEAVGGKVGADVAVAATLDALRRLLRA